MCADLALFDLRGLQFAGAAVHDPVASLMLCASVNAAHTVVNGRMVVRDGQLTTVDLGPLIERHNGMARSLTNVAG
jgi:cytosine/adenosine deaminase-related metal-dependent hydrolase